jgi:hypothetical protein
MMLPGYTTCFLTMLPEYFTCFLHDMYTIWYVHSSKWTKALISMLGMSTDCACSTVALMYMHKMITHCYMHLNMATLRLYNSCAWGACVHAQYNNSIRSSQKKLSRAWFPYAMASPCRELLLTVVGI